MIYQDSGPQVDQDCFWALMTLMTKATLAIKDMPWDNMYYNDADDHEGNDDFDDESNANNEHDAGVTRRQHIFIMLMLMITLVMMTWMTKATMQLMLELLWPSIYSADADEGEGDGVDGDDNRSGVAVRQHVLCEEEAPIAWLRNMLIGKHFALDHFDDDDDCDRDIFDHFDDDDDDRDHFDHFIDKDDRDHKRWNIIRATVWFCSSATSPLWSNKWMN